MVHSSGLASTEATGPKASVSLALMRTSDVEAPDRRRCHGRHKIPASKGEEGWWSAQTAAASEELQPGDASPPHRRGDGVPARRPICANGPNGKCEASTRRLAACGRSTRARTSHSRAKSAPGAPFHTRIRGHENNNVPQAARSRLAPVRWCRAALGGQAGCMAPPVARSAALASPGGGFEHGTSTPSLRPAAS